MDADNLDRRIKSILIVPGDVEILRLPWNLIADPACPNSIVRYRNQVQLRPIMLGQQKRHFEALPSVVYQPDVQRIEGADLRAAVSDLHMQELEHRALRWVNDIVTCPIKLGMRNG